MRKILTVVLLAVSCQAFAQQDSLKTYNANRVRITSNGMMVLGGWGIANVGVGAVGWATASSAEGSYFYQMNTIWGSANFITALLTYASTQPLPNKKLSAAEILREQEKIEKRFFIGECLDVAFIGGGLYLKLAGDSQNSPRMEGYGESILLQGSFLLVFDVLMHKAVKGNGNKLRNFLEKNPVTFDGRRVGIIFHM